METGMGLCGVRVWVNHWRWRDGFMGIGVCETHRIVSLNVGTLLYVSYFLIKKKLMKKNETEMNKKRRRCLEEGKWLGQSCRRSLGDCGTQGKAGQLLCSWFYSFWVLEFKLLGIELSALETAYALPTLMMVETTSLSFHSLLYPRNNYGCS